MSTNVSPSIISEATEPDYATTPNADGRHDRRKSNDDANENSDQGPTITTSGTNAEKSGQSDAKQRRETDDA